MKQIERLCNNIIKFQTGRPDGDYKKEILKACKKSKKYDYKVSPYELMFLEGYKVFN